MTLEVGQPVPDITLVSSAGEEVAISSYKGKQNLVVAFFIHAFTGG